MTTIDSNVTLTLNLNLNVYHCKRCYVYIYGYGYAYGSAYVVNTYDDGYNIFVTNISVIFVVAYDYDYDGYISLFFYYRYFTQFYCNIYCHSSCNYYCFYYYCCSCCYYNNDCYPCYNLSYCSVSISSIHGRMLRIGPVIYDHDGYFWSCFHFYEKEMGLFGHYFSC